MQTAATEGHHNIFELLSRYELAGIGTILYSKTTYNIEMEERNTQYRRFATTPLHEAVRQGDELLVEALLKCEHVDVNASIWRDDKSDARNDFQFLETKGDLPGLSIEVTPLYLALFMENWKMKETSCRLCPGGCECNISDELVWQRSRLDTALAGHLLGKLSNC